MPLHALPTELLAQVVEEVFPEDFESLMLSCKTLHNVGTRYLELYNDGRNRFGKLRFRSGCDVSWLINLAKDPVIPYYTTTLDLQGARRLGESRPMLRVEEIQPHVEALIRESPYMAFNGVDRGFWVNNIMSLAGLFDDTDTDALGLSSLDLLPTISPILLYMTLFPNVTHLTLPWIRVSPTRNTAFYDEIRHGQAQSKIILEAISLNVWSSHTREALSKLRYLSYRIPRTSAVYSLVQVILPYITLPALEELHARSLVAFDIQEFQPQPAHMTWLNPDAYSNLHTICFRHCCMSAAGISRVLAHTPRLTTLRYGHGKRHDTDKPYGVYWDAGAFVAAIERHIGGHLRHLTVEVEGRHAEGIHGHIASMHGFTKLETLELDIRVIVGVSQFIIRHTPGRTLTEILPSCIRRFALLVKMGGYDDYGRMDVAVQLYLGFGSVHRSRLPNLDSYSVRFYAMRNRKRMILRKEQKSAFDAEGVVVSWTRVIAQLAFVRRQPGEFRRRQPTQRNLSLRRHHLLRRSRIYKPISVPEHERVMIMRDPCGPYN